jgi:glyoxylase-like metal-dependent hydrolase (beta-lactamase superfamily II)
VVQERIRQRVRGARPEPPAATFDHAFTVYLGTREVDVRFLGRGNTGGDAVVYVRDAKVVATGDLVVHPVPFAFITEWASTLGKLAELDATAIVPGHGELQHDMRYVRALAAALASISAQAHAAQAAGRSIEQAHKTIDVRAFERETCGDDPWCHLGFPGAFVQPAFDRAFREAKGGRSATRTRTEPQAEPRSETGSLTLALVQARIAMLRCRRV